MILEKYSTVSVMKKYSLLLAMLIPLNLWGQKDTIIWYWKV